MMSTLCRWTLQAAHLARWMLAIHTAVISVCVFQVAMLYMLLLLLQSVCIFQRSRSDAPAYIYPSIYMSS